MQQGVHRAELVVEHVVDEGPHHDPGDEVGEEHHRLGDPLEPLARQLREQDGAGDLQKGVDAEERQIVEDGVAGDAPRLARQEEVLKVLERHPRAAEDPVVVVVLLEGQHNAAHGDVAHQDDHDGRRQQHEPLDPVFFQVPEEGMFAVFHLTGLLCALFFVHYHRSKAAGAKQREPIMIGGKNYGVSEKFHFLH